MQSLQLKKDNPRKNVPKTGKNMKSQFFFQSLILCSLCAGVLTQKTLARNHGCFSPCRHNIILFFTLGGSFFQLLILNSFFVYSARVCVIPKRIRELTHGCFSSCCHIISFSFPSDCVFVHWIGIHGTFQMSRLTLANQDTRCDVGNPA